MSIIKFEKVSKNYGEVKVLDNLNLSIEEGEFITVIGSSGCGKTTVLKLINGLIRPDSGEVYIHGKDISKIDQTDLRRTIGYVIQGAGLFPHMTIEKNITYVLDLIKTDKEKTVEVVRKLIKTVGLDMELLKRYPDELSGGQKQRVGIARALANNPKLLLMDEPFGAVDEITRKLLQDELIKIQKESASTIFFITHDINEALKLGKRVLVMDKGKIQQFDTPENIVKTPATKFVEKLVQS